MSESNTKTVRQYVVVSDFSIPVPHLWHLERFVRAVCPTHLAAFSTPHGSSQVTNQRVLGVVKLDGVAYSDTLPPVHSPLKFVGLHGPAPATLVRILFFIVAMLLTSFRLRLRVVVIRLLFCFSSPPLLWLLFGLLRYLILWSVFKRSTCCRIVCRP
jgi:hypothetical protein